ncbi:glycosyl transferase [Rhodobacter sp. TJ_12]|uniref:glycosyltransferase family 2 protein n=1 Tax=Rhodobacter sp. TJ_12 TaxID=2029399 RepID=UPI001CBCC2D6|nr:glycosyltransferase family 2 protein [Rhodobacter sp. TJ_12]MBZ4021781.1 glycosyl transferase [Rhodobacter sp. TJ_12]
MVDGLWSVPSLVLQEHRAVIETISWGILAVGLLINLISFVQLPAALRELRRYSMVEDSDATWDMLISDATLPVSVLVPAYNEEATIVDNVRSMLFLQYPDLEVIVVNDGSSDRTLAQLVEAFSLEQTLRAHELHLHHAPIRGLYASRAYPGLLVVDKQNGGSKADAINAAINLSRNPLFCVVDADSLLEVESLLKAARPFMEDPKGMTAVGGTVRVLNGCTVQNGQIVEIGLPRSFLPLIQSLEYIRAFLVNRLAWSHWQMLSIISGAFGLFRRDLALEIGGFNKASHGEDYDFIVRLHRHMQATKRPYAMRYVPEPVCWTEAPEDLRTLATQRKRWQRGALQVLVSNADMIGNPRYGRFGLLGLTHSLLVDLIAPVAEIAGFLLLPLFFAAGAIEGEFLLAFFGLFVVFGVFYSVMALVIEELELKRTPHVSGLLLLGLVAVVENFGYRQLNSLWRIRGLWEFLIGTHDWGEMRRKGAKRVRDG